MGVSPSRAGCSVTAHVFLSNATTLVAGDTNGKRDAFRTDLVTGAVVRVSVGTGTADDRVMRVPIRRR
ncbi:MAG: hypothetical protein KDB28_14500 [Tetrasphaera sp.]|nr:hypothetical protein [Tetrasphaera sp.]